LSGRLTLQIRLGPIKSNFELYIKHCDEINEEVYPAGHETISFIKTISDGRLKSSSIKIAVTSISTIHRFNSKEEPTKNADVKIEMRRMNKKLGGFAKQAYGIDKTVLQKNNSCYR
jgi:hypothetical protein